MCWRYIDIDLDTDTNTDRDTDTDTYTPLGMVDMYAPRTQSSAGPQLEHLASLPIALREVLPVHEVVVHPHGRVPHDIACMHTMFRL